MFLFSVVTDRGLTIRCSSREFSQDDFGGSFHREDKDLNPLGKALLMAGVVKFWTFSLNIWFSVIFQS